jgi:hypothetical protein
MKKLYLSGAISKNPYYKEDFKNAARKLTEAGYTVLSPVDFCSEGWDWNRCMRRCIELLVSQCNAVALVLSDYISEGTELELHIATRLGMPVRTVETWIKERGKNER